MKMHTRYSFSYKDYTINYFIVEYKFYPDILKKVVRFSFKKNDITQKHIYLPLHTDIELNDQLKDYIEKYAIDYIDFNFNKGEQR